METDKDKIIAWIVSHILLVLAIVYLLYLIDFVSLDSNGVIRSEDGYLNTNLQYKIIRRSPGTMGYNVNPHIA